MEEKVTLQLAYLAMFQFIDNLHKRTHNDELGSILGDLSLLADGTTADPAAWGDWLECIEKAQAGKVNAQLMITPPHKS